MTPRERLLAIGVGVAVGAFGLQYVISNVRQSFEGKQARVDAAQSDLEKAELTEQLGMSAAEKLNKVRSKSLPTNLQVLGPQYRDWLIDIAKESGMSNINVVIPKTPAPMIGKVDAYKAYDFTLTGNCGTDRIIDLLARYYDKDYLHNVYSLKLQPIRDNPKAVDVTLKSRVLALKGVDSKQKSPEGSSGRLAMSLDEYKSTILNRNPFSPPNQPPKLASSRSHEIKLGEDWRLALEGSDPEQGRVEFELVSTELPDGLEFRRGELRWKPQELGEYRVTVRASDDGWPRESSEERLTLKVVEPPKETPKVESPKFDIASQAFVTMMVSGRSGPQAAVRSRTEGKTFDLKEGSSFEVGEIKAKVLSINLQEEFIELETEGERWLLDWNSSVAEAFKKGQIN